MFPKSGRAVAVVQPLRQIDKEIGDEKAST